MAEPTVTEKRPEPEPAKHVPPTGKLIPKPTVFIPAATLLIGFVIITSFMPERMGDWIGQANSAVVGDLGWWYIAIVTGFVVFSLWAAMGRTGDVVLGKDGDEPEFKLGSWFAMLFAAGMGIGLVFWGVAEPLNHFNTPPPGANPDTAAGHARTAMDVTFLHWGLSAWAIYVVVGLGVAYAVHRRGLPVSIRWALEPVLGRYAHGFIGDVVDIIAVLGTVFGVATSLGLGVSQLGAGLSFMGWVTDPGKWFLVLLIIVITSFALASVVTGVDKGIRLLSNLNMVLAVVFVIFVLIAGPTVFILTDFFTQVGSYLQNFVSLTFDGRPYQGAEGQGWLSGWTTYYWGWWMSWAPFVGVFIARISKGRTVREFVAGVLLVPTLVTFLWFSVLGGTAIYREMFQGGGIIGENGVDTNTALFQMLDHLPMATITSILAMTLLVVFFVTSSDSASFVVDMLSSGGNPNPPRWSRAMWAAMEGAIAAVLLFVGLTAQETNPDANPLGALQTMAILLALPFSIVMVLIVISLLKSLTGEARIAERESRKWFAERVAQHINENDLVDND
jgi:choline/glycine/proline betaine transport protein